MLSPNWATKQATTDAVSVPRVSLGIAAPEPDAAVSLIVATGHLGIETQGSASNRSSSPGWAQPTAGAPAVDSVPPRHTLITMRLVDLERVCSLIGNVTPSRAPR